MEKKGQSEVLTTTLLFELIIGVLIASVLMYALLDLNQTSKFSKEYMQQDLMLTKEMIRSLPGDLEMEYGTGSWCLTEDDENFVKGINCKVQIKKEGNEITVKKLYIEKKEKEDEKGSI